MIEFLSKLINFFNKYNIPYMLSGGVALGVHTLGRFTRNIDIVVMLRLEDVPVLSKTLKMDIIVMKMQLKKQYVNRGCLISLIMEAITKLI